jgi:hypothetical protein
LCVHALHDVPGPTRQLACRSCGGVQTLEMNLEKAKKDEGHPLSRCCTGHYACRFMDVTSPFMPIWPMGSHFRLRGEPYALSRSVRTRKLFSVHITISILINFYLLPLYLSPEIYFVDLQVTLKFRY